MTDDRIRALDYNMILALLVVGIELLWSSQAYFTLTYKDIGITHEMTQVVNCSLATVSIILALLSMKRCDMRFTMIVFFWSLTCLVSNITPLFNGQETDDVVFGIAMILVCCVAFLRKREWLLLIGSLLMTVELALIMADAGSIVKSAAFIYGAAGVLFTYYACGLFIYLDLGKDYLHVVTDSITEEHEPVDPGNVFEAISDATFGILLFVASTVLVKDNIMVDDCIPLAILSLAIIAISFFGMKRGYVPEGVMLLIVALYFLCQTITVFAFGQRVVGMFAFLCVFPLAVVVVTYLKRRDSVKLLSATLMTLFLLMVAFLSYRQSLGYIALAISFISTYCGACRMIYSELGYRMPFYQYL